MIRNTFHRSRRAGIVLVMPLRSISSDRILRESGTLRLFLQRRDRSVWSMGIAPGQREKGEAHEQVVFESMIFE